MASSAFFLPMELTYFHTRHVPVHYHELIMDPASFAIPNEANFSLLNWAMLSFTLQHSSLSEEVQ